MCNHLFMNTLRLSLFSSHCHHPSQCQHCPRRHCCHNRRHCCHCRHCHHPCHCHCRNCHSHLRTPPLLPPLHSAAATGVGGRGASTIVTMIDDTVEWEKCEEREGGEGAGQNACTSPYIEGYRDKVGAKWDMLYVAILNSYIS
jgi:hypothetical protein